MARATQNTDEEDASSAETNVDLLFLALSNPTRRMLLRDLMQEPLSAKIFSDAHDVALGTASYHLSRVLFEQCHIVELRKRYKRRGATEKVYALKPDANLIIRLFVHSAPFLEQEAEHQDDQSMFAVHPVSVDEVGVEEVEAAVKTLKAALTSARNRTTKRESPALKDLLVGVSVAEPGPRIGVD